ncbi:WD repeat-containing protein 81-like [Homarus americanus]|uniref:WD repeat-containing protein 81-like n=1 Tax=Homarus americanus TaxID=6706 RepID=UPI001C43FD1A|nr:WD repeat-containing protein 81-like [Homarus americanus]XP_042218296.1 WD repeat-containing protein 81-like [Homarus americanus]
MATRLLEQVSQSLTLPTEYCCQGSLPDLVESFVYSPWLRAVVRDGTFSPPPLHDTLSAAEVQSSLQLGERIGDLWQRVLIQVIPKNEIRVYPLARNSGHSPGLMADVSYSQLLHYVATSNNKNLWKDAYKKYSDHGVAVQWKGGAQVGTDSLNNVLREVLWRLYGCKIIPIQGESRVHSGIQNSRVHGPHSNTLPAICALEGDQSMFVILSNVHHNVQQCVSFSPAKLNGSEARPLFVLYQILEAARDTHDRGLHLGDFTLSHLFIDDSLYLSFLPRIQDNLIHPDSLQPLPVPREKAGNEVLLEVDSRGEKSYRKISLPLDASQCMVDREFEHTFDNQDHGEENNIASQSKLTGSVLMNSLLTITRKSDVCGSDCTVKDVVSEESKNLSEANQFDTRVLEYQRLLSSEEAFDVLKQVDSNNTQDAELEMVLKCSLVQLTQLWVGHQITTLDYLLCLNFFAGRKFNSPRHHPTVPWVTDFSSRNTGWRDLTKTKFRLNKGDQQLDHTYQMAASHGQSKQAVAHHVTEVFSEITYYVYKARITPKELLTKYVRQQWVPEHYPATITRLYLWTPDECIPEFYTDSSIFKSIHPDLGDLEVPEWCADIEDFLNFHRTALESERVSQRLHHWIDLNFGHKLSGGASVKAKNVCLQLVDAHTTLSSGGVVQLFTTPHPPRLTASPYLGRSPPKLNISAQQETKFEKSDETSEADSAPERQDEEMENIKSLALSRKLSRSRTSLFEEKQADLPSIQISHDYNPLIALNQLEMLFNLVLKSSRIIPEQPTKCRDIQQAVKQAAHLRRVRDMQAVGCIIVEMFSPSKCRILSTKASLRERYIHAHKLLTHDQTDIPRCIRHTLQVIFQIKNWKDVKDNTLPNKYEPVSSDGLPPPSPHQLLQPLINVIVFPSYFPKLYRFVCKMRQYSQLLNEAHMMLREPHKRKEYILKVAEIRVKMAAKDLPNLLPILSAEGLDLVLPYLIELFEYPESAVNAAWYLTSVIAQALGPEEANKHLLPPVVKLFEAEVVTDKHLKLFHRSFLLQLIVWFGLHKFLTFFVTPLIEGVGGYKEVLGKSHQSAEIVRKQSTTLKSVDISLGTEGITSPCEEDSHSSTTELTLRMESESTGNARVEADLTDAEAEAEPEVFVFEGGEDEVDASSPDTPLQDASDQLRSPLASETLSLDEVSLQEGIGSIPSLCPSPHSPSMSGDEEEPVSDPDTPTPLAAAYGASSGSTTTSINIPKGGPVSVSVLKSDDEYSTSLPDFRLDKDRYITNIDFGENSKDSLKTSYKGADSQDTKQKMDLDHNMSDVCCESVLWLAGRLGPVLTSRYVTRNLLRMLTLCYLPDSGALVPIPVDPSDELSVTRKRIFGDHYAKKVLHCLSEIACLYGEQVILLQYLCHICELVASCRRKLSATMEGGLLGAMALLQHLLPYLTDSTFMEHLQETLIRNAVYPVIRLLSSTKVNFPHGGAARGVLACRVIDCLFIMALRVGREMSKSILMPTVTRLMTAFDKCHNNSSSQLGASPRSLEAEEVLGVGDEAASSSSSGLQASPGTNVDSVKAKALEELKQVLTPELAYLSYVPLCRFLGASYMEATLPNHDLLRSLCLQYDENNQADHAAVLTDDGLALNNSTAVVDDTSGRKTNNRSPNVAVTGNRIDIRDAPDGFSNPQCDLPPSIGFDTTVDITKYTGSRMENTQRHLRGNWLAYWEHEIGRSEQDARFNFKQIKLQTFIGHTNSVKSIHVLDNENSFISCSKDKTVKLWSLRSQGDGNAHISAQWTYTGHKKSVFGVTFSDSMRYAASCDSTVHVWDPFICAGVKQLDSLRHSPVTVLTAMAAPSTQLVAATTDATLKFIDLRTCNYTHEFKVSMGGAGLVRCIDTSGDGRLVTVAHSSGVISVLDTRTGHLLSTWKPHEGEVLCMRWYKDGTFISSALDQTVSVWSVDDNKLKFTLRGPTEPVHLICLYGDEVITGTTANRIGVHTSVSPTASFSSTRLRSDTFRGVLTTMAVLPLNRLLLLGADNGTIRLLC